MRYRHAVDRIWPIIQRPLLPDMKTRFWVLILIGLFTQLNFVLAQGDKGKPSIFICGDSTAKNFGKGKNGEAVAGWGTPFADFFDSAKVTIKNVGHAGTSSRSYYEGDWSNVVPQIQPGDFVLLVF